MEHVLVRVFAGKAYIRQGSITQIVKSIRKSSMRGCGLRSCLLYTSGGTDNHLCLVDLTAAGRIRGTWQTAHGLSLIHI